MTRPRAQVLALVLTSVACSGPGATALHTLPGTAGADFYSLPFPSDLRLRPDGTFDLTTYPHPAGQIGQYVAMLQNQVRGAGTGAAILFRFDAPLDPTSLPASAADSLRPGAAAQVVDLTPGSPTYGAAAPILATFNPADGNFIGPNWLSLRPFPGRPLRERTTYAALLTTRLRAADGGPVRRDPALELLLSDAAPADAALSAAWARYAPLRDYLHKAGTAADVVGATVFTTTDATSLMARLRRAIHDQVPAPAPADLRHWRNHDGVCDIYVGTYQSPNFQRGDPPYLTTGGDIATDKDGAPVVVRTETLRFAVSVPRAPMPPGGWPVALYAHGTGGDYQSFVREGIDLRAARIEDGGAVLGRMAVISIDQVLHGPRDPTHSSPDLTFFNLRNLLAARDNPRQGAADDFQLLRLVQGFKVPAAPVTGLPIQFDPRRIYFVGHSQGGLTGPLFLGAEPAVRAAVLSGAGAVLVLSLLNKTEPTDIAGLVAGLLKEDATPDHPLLNLLQAYFEPTDPNNYGRLYFTEPPAGMAAKSIFQSLGVTDHYTPVPNIAALALSMGVQPVWPQLVPVPGLDLAAGQPQWTAEPVRGNVAGGQATAVLRQYPQAEGSDGHFVLFDQWDARHDWSRFLAHDAADGLAALSD